METIRVKDLMFSSSEYAVVSKDATLLDVVLVLEEARHKLDPGIHKHRSVLVEDETHKIIGKLTYMDVLRALEPRYEEIGDVDRMSRFGLSTDFLQFLREHFGLWEGTFQELCARVAGKKVGNMIEEPSPIQYIHEDAYLADAVHQMVMNNELSLLVTKNDEIVGIIRLVDAFEKVCDQIKECPR
ncbi:CBS domain-containing protein [Thermodesulfobacteriota bacterium]